MYSDLAQYKIKDKIVKYVMTLKAHYHYHEHYLCSHVKPAQDFVILSVLYLWWGVIKRSDIMSEQSDGWSDIF